MRITSCLRLNIKKNACVWAFTGLLVAGLANPVWADDYKVKYTYDTSTNKVLTNVGNSNAFPDAKMGKIRGKSTYMQKAKERKQAAAKRQKAAAKLATQQNNGAGSASAADAAKTAAPNGAATVGAAASTTYATPVTASARTSSQLATSSPATSRSSSVQRSAKAPTGRTRVTRKDNLLKIHTVDENSILPAPRIEYQEQGGGYRYDGKTWAFATFDASKRSPRIVRYYGWHKDTMGENVRGWYEVDLNPLILAAAKATGVDPLLVEIIMRHESNFNPYARSPVGAVGLMQLMPETAGGLGISDVYDVRDNIRGGAQYIAYQLARFNSVPLALAAYNAGPGAVLEYGGVPPYAETQYYVSTIYGEYQAGLRYRQNNR